MLDAIIAKSLNSQHSVQHNIIQTCYNYFDAGSDPNDFQYLQDDMAGGTLPATWQTIPKIRSKVKVVLGELVSKGYDFRVEAINKEAKVRKLQAKDEMRVSMMMQPYAQELEQLSGLPTAEEWVPEDEEELDEYFDKTYKEKSEVIMYWALKFLDKKSNWKQARYALFRDILIAGKAICKHEINNGIPTIKRVDPRYFVHDAYAEDDFLTDSSYFGEVSYIPLADAVVKYNLSKEEIDTAYSNYKEFNKILDAKKGNQQRNQELFSWFGSLSGASGLKWFKETPTGLRVMVMEACWADYKPIKYKSSVDKYGREHMKRMKPDSQDREGVTSRRVKTWRYGCLVGGQYLKKWGELPNQPRDNETLAETQPPYTVLIPDFVNGKSVSLVEQIQGLQNLKDIITYNVQLAMSRAGAKGFIYDVSQCPEDWDVGEVIKYLKTVGIAFINSRQNGTQSQFNQFQSFDLSLSQSVSQYLELSRWVDSEMDSVSGINEARQGIVQGASQAVGVTRSALLQSSLTTAPLFSQFDDFSSRIWQHQARLVKIAFPENPERFAAILGDTGIDFLKNEVDLELDDYGVYVDVTPALLDDLNSFQQIIMAALQAGSIDFADAMVLLQEKDVIEGIRKYQKLAQEKQEERFEQERQLMAEQEQMRAQVQQQAVQQQAMFNEQVAERAAQRDLQKQKAKTQGDITKELVSQRGQANLKKLEKSLE